MSYWKVESAKTHCKRGHEFTDENTGRDKRPGKGNRFCKQCASDRVKRIRKERAEELAAYKLQRGCDSCGYNKCAAVLGFHHRDPTKKVMQVPNMYHYSRKKRDEEIAKCDLLCANCHFEEHDRLRKTL